VGAAPSGFDAIGAVEEVRPAAGGDVWASDVAVATAFVLRRPEAARVTVVGDFNRWNPDATPLERRMDGTWTTSVPLAPGRHAYAFVIDGVTWTPDPRLPVTRDVDYGRDHSVLVVGAP
jgi:1,4-alpha-glucan branching enzyme